MRWKYWPTCVRFMLSVRRLRPNLVLSQSFMASSIAKTQIFVTWGFLFYVIWCTPGKYVRMWCGNVGVWTCYLIYCMTRIGKIKLWKLFPFGKDLFYWHLSLWIEFADGFFLLFHQGLRTIANALNRLFCNLKRFKRLRMLSVKRCPQNSTALLIRYSEWLAHPRLYVKRLEQPTLYIEFSFTWLRQKRFC